MKIAALIALLALPACSRSDADEVKEMACVLVVSSINGSIRRCESQEVVCFDSPNGFSCPIVK